MTDRAKDRLTLVVGAALQKHGAWPEGAHRAVADEILAAGWQPPAVPPPPPICRATEGATGIDCELEAGHQCEHEGAHKSGGEHDGIGYDLFVRWPYQPWDIERGIAPHTEGVNP